MRAFLYPHVVLCRGDSAPVQNLPAIEQLGTCDGACEVCHSYLEQLSIAAEWSAALFRLLQHVWWL